MSRVAALASERDEDGSFLLTFAGEAPVELLLARAGRMPLPPYIKRDDDADDRERYQTVFAQARGSIAAPTAGLHFTANFAAALAARGVELARVTLHVGYGTFQPIRVDRIRAINVKFCADNAQSFEDTTGSKNRRRLGNRHA